MTVGSFRLVAVGVREVVIFELYFEGKVNFDNASLCSKLSALALNIESKIINKLYREPQSPASAHLSTWHSIPSQCPYSNPSIKK